MGKPSKENLHFSFIFQLINLWFIKRGIIVNQNLPDIKLWYSSVSFSLNNGEKPRNIHFAHTEEKEIE